MFSKIFTEIKTYKKSFTLYVLLLFFCIFFLHWQPKYIEQVNKAFHETPLIILFIFIITFMCRLIGGKKIAFNLSQKNMIFFSIIFICSLVFCFLDFFYWHNIKLSYSAIGEYKNALSFASPLEIILTPFLYSCLLFFLIQSLFLIIFICIPEKHKKYYAINIKFIFYNTVIFYFIFIIGTLIIKYGTIFS